jgi:signal transduction histidine kinase
MRLTEFIEQHHKKIITEWVQFARTLHPWSEGMSEKALRDHAEELLTALVSDMESPQSSLQQSEKSKGRAAGGPLTSVGRKHASDRLETGFKLDQLVSEYRALRASVVRLWAAEHGDKEGELIRFNEAIDETLAEAAVRYSELMNHTREQFLAILGHDLRNPLGAIVMGATILTKSESIDDKQARVATRILNSAGRMTRMVSYLLDLARTRLGASIPITLTRMDLTPVCQQVIAELEVAYPDRQLRLESKGDLFGEWDSDRLTQVISNLVANALQYGGAAVSVVAQEHGDEVALQVHNDGPPIAKSALKNIFEPMVRKPTQNGNRNATGLGLGLYIAREVVIAHGGTIGVTSTEKEGTTFTVQIPRRPPAKKKQTARFAKKQPTRRAAARRSAAPIAGLDNRARATGRPGSRRDGVEQRAEEPGGSRE